MHKLRANMVNFYNRGSTLRGPQLPCQPVPHNLAGHQQTFPTPPKRERWLERLNTKTNTVILYRQLN